MNNVWRNFVETQEPSDTFFEELEKIDETIKEGESDQPLDIRSPEFLRQT